MKSWKTTVLGVLAIVGALIAAAQAVLAGHPIDFAALGSAIMAGIGLIAAKDHA